MTKPAIARVTDPASCYSGTVASSAAELARLHSEAAHLWENKDSSSKLDFFLATLHRTRWLPRIAVVREGERIVGLIYAKERKFGSIRTGLILADCTLGGSLIADFVDQSKVFETGINQLIGIAGVRGLRLLVPADGQELRVLKRIGVAQELNFSDIPIDNHVVLSMGATFEEFLDTFSPKTRRNFRYFRNKSIAANNCFIEQIDHEEFKNAAIHLSDQDVVGANRDEIDRGTRMFQATARPLRVGLKSEQGEWLSVLGGWYETNRVVIFMQLNSDKKYARQSLSLVMRSYLIEMLIRQGVRESLWWGGVAPPLKHYAKPIETRWVHLDKNTWGWRTLRRILHSQRNGILGKFLPISEWIVESEAK